MASGLTQSHIASTRRQNLVAAGTSAKHISRKNFQRLFTATVFTSQCHRSPDSLFANVAFIPGVALRDAVRWPSAPRSFPVNLSMSLRSSESSLSPRRSARAVACFASIFIRQGSAVFSPSMWADGFPRVSSSFPDDVKHRCDLYIPELPIGFDSTGCRRPALEGRNWRYRCPLWECQNSTGGNVARR